mgnify:CR=1 FL=1
MNGLDSKHYKTSQETERNALCASTSATGEGNAGLVVKSLADVAKACGAIDATPKLQGSSRKSPYGKPRSFFVGDKSEATGRQKQRRKRPTCFDCYDNRLEFERLYKDCPNRSGAQSHRQVRVNKRMREDQEQEVESDEPEDQEEPTAETDRGVFQAISNIKRGKKSTRRK